MNLISHIAEIAVLPAGNFTSTDKWLYVISDVAVWLAFMVIPYFIYLYLKKKSNTSLPLLFQIFGAFIFISGLNFLMDALLFWWPNYKVAAYLNFITAIITWITVVVVYKNFSAAIALKTTHDFEIELAERKKSELLFKGFLESAPDAMVITNTKGIIVMVNAQAENIFGYPRNEIIGNPIEILIPSRYKKEHVHHRDQYIEAPKTRAMGAGMALFGTNKQGNEFPVEVSLSPIKIDNNEMLVMSAIRDITKQKETEAEIKKVNENLENLVRERTHELEETLKIEQTIRLEIIQNQNRLKLLTEMSEVLVSSLDINKTLSVIATRISPEIADWCTIDQAEADGTFTCLAASHAEFTKLPILYEFKSTYQPDPLFPKGLHSVLESQQPVLMADVSPLIISEAIKSEKHRKLMDKIGLTSVIIIPLLVRNKVFGLLTLALTSTTRKYHAKDLEFAEELGRRITLALENAQLYQELQNVNADLEQRVTKRTLELEAINKELEAFSYSVSHDLRAPLRSIDGFSNKILKEYSTSFNEQAKDYFSRIMNASRKMGVLIDDLLKLARLSRVEMKIEKTNLSDIARNIINELKETYPERNINFYVKEGMAEMTDKNLMQIALQNLLGNAWKYSINQSTASIVFDSFEKDNQLIYFIRDNGVGFDMKYVDKLFGAFQRLHSVSEFEGTGIGLATVQRIIRRHHGNIWAESEVNKGTTFFFTLNQ